jgi:hypothetical protein
MITPQKGVGDWQFGMTRDEVRKLINKTPRVVQKIDLTDIFSDLGLHFINTSDKIKELKSRRNGVFHS